MDNLARTQASAQCHVLFSCCQAEERVNQIGSLALFGIDDEASCSDKLGAFASVQSASLSEAVTAGRAKYDEALAQKCSQPTVDAGNKCDAQAFFAPVLPADCKNADGSTKNAVTGLVADGALCLQTFECASVGSTCVLNTSTTPGEQLLTTKGKCTGLPKGGEACPGEQCASGFFCGDDTVCHALGGTGTQCGSSDQCQAGLRCSFDLSPPSCDTAFDDGADCSQNADCKNRCDAVTDICVPKNADGASCNDNSDCSGGVCNFSTDTCGADVATAVKVTVDQCIGKPI